MDRNYLSVRLTIWHLEAAIDKIRPITMENGELSICTEEGAAVQCHLPPLCDKRCGHHISNFFVLRPGNESDTPWICCAYALKGCRHPRLGTPGIRWFVCVCVCVCVCACVRACVRVRTVHVNWLHK